MLCAKLCASGFIDLQAISVKRYVLLYLTDNAMLIGVLERLLLVMCLYSLVLSVYILLYIDGVFYGFT
jgi:hypothetical protein